NPAAKACRLTAVNLTRKGAGGDGTLKNDQLGKFQWLVAPQVTFIPFRGKLALFSPLFVDTDVSLFVAPSIAGLSERAPCGAAARRRKRRARTARARRAPRSSQLRESQRGSSNSGSRGDRPRALEVPDAALGQAVVGIFASFKGSAAKSTPPPAGAHLDRNNA